MKTLLFTLAMVSLLLFTPAWVDGEEESGNMELEIPPFSICIDVAIETFGNESVQSQVTNCLKRELRSLGDVIVTDANPDLRLWVFVVETKAENQLLGYSFVWFFTEVFSKEEVTRELEIINATSLSRKLDRTDILTISNLLLMGREQSLENIRSGSCATGPPDSLDEFCKDTVARFDMEVLEEKRKEHQSPADFLEEGKTQ